MIVSTYCRIENAAGGVWASDRAFIKAVQAILQPTTCRPHEWRAFRHGFIREVLAERDDQRVMCLKWRM